MGRSLSSTQSIINVSALKNRHVFKGAYFWALVYDSMQKDEQNQPRRPSVFKELREGAQLTQEQLAREMGKTLSTIRRWENGDEPKMTREEWDKYCELVHKNFNELPKRLSVPAEVH